MTIDVNCESCGEVLHAKDSAAGSRADCPECGAPVQIPDVAYDAIVEADTEEASVPDTDSPGSERKPCPTCGEMIISTAAKCRFCGEIFDPALKKTAGVRGGTSVEERAEALLKERQDKSTALQLFLTGLFGCVAPILLIYGIVFLLKRPHPFPRKGLAIAGTVLHGLYTLILLVNVIIHMYFQ